MAAVVNDGGPKQYCNGNGRCCLLFYCIIWQKLQHNNGSGGDVTKKENTI